MSEIIKAKVISVIFEAFDSPYKVINTIYKNESLSILGFFPNINTNLDYEFKGEYVLHPKFGKQFKADSYSLASIDSKEGIIAYLSSEKFKGVGEVSALKIYEEIGPDCIQKIKEDKNVLKKIKGFNNAKIDSIYNALIENEYLDALYVELYSYGLTPKMVSKLYDKYQDKTLLKVKENPYRLIYELDGFGFIKCDSLAFKVGISYDNKTRIEEAIIYTLNNVCYNYGFSFLTNVQLVNSTYNLLNKDKTSIVSKDMIIKYIDELSSINRIIEENDRYFVKTIYDDEVLLANQLINLNKNKPKKLYEPEKLNDYLKEIEEYFSISYTLSQKEAIFNAINSNISIITGGPGTGKTTIIKGILHLLASLDGLAIVDDDFFKKVLLCAPTGRAAKRLGESCNMRSKTIHKALGYAFDEGFEFGVDNKLSESIIIVDEVSMIDISLAARLLSAIKENAKIILVGDEFQLPSVGPGNVLHDIIESGIINVSRLTEIMRQSLDSDIIKLSNDVNNKYINYDIFKRKKEVFFYPSDGNTTLDKIILFVNNFIEKGGNLLPDLQILIPMYSGICGIDIVNKVIQEKFNPSLNKIEKGNKIFKENDKVLQTQNDPTLGIMNGDIGVIKGIYKDEDEEYLNIDFDGFMVKYPTHNLDNLTLAYAISVHKSQGMEYKNVILPIIPSYYIMLKRKLIYTAITRAKEKLIIIGDYNALCSGVTKDDDKRQTTLEQRLLNKLEFNKKIIYINDENIPFDTLGEEGMENITPYSFMND